MVECPVCSKVLESEFALKAHLRLTKDAVHMAFHQQDQKIIVPEANVPVPSTLQGTSPKLIDTLDRLVKEQDYIFEGKARTNTTLMKLKELIEGERDIEKEYKKLIESEEESLEQERQKVREEVMQQHQEDVDRAVENAKIEFMRNREQEIAAACAETKTKYYFEVYWKVALYIPCVFCKENIFVQPGSGLHKWLAELATRGGFCHPECRMDYEQQQAERNRQEDYYRRAARLEDDINRYLKRGEENLPVGAIAPLRDSTRYKHG